MMRGHKIIFSCFFVLFSVSFAFCQTESLKTVVNNLALYKEKKDLKYLGNAKKQIDSVLKASPDSLDLEKNVYKILINASILYIDSLNKVNQPAALFVQTTDLFDKLSVNRRIYRYTEELDFARVCLANVYMRKAFVFINKSDFVNALKLYKDAEKYTPSFKPLKAHIAYVNNKLGNINTAVKYYTELAEDDSTKAEYVEAASTIYKSLGDTDLALNIVKHGRELLPDDKSILLDEANIYNNREDYQSLLQLLPVLLDIYPNNADIAFVAANCYDHLDQYDQAEKLYLHAIDINTSAYEPIFNLGLLYLKEIEINKRKNNYRNALQAAQWLEKANEISPNEIKCLKALEMVYTETGNTNQLYRINNQLKQLTNQ